MDREQSLAHPISRISPITWLNLVCLDAPIVAISWQWLFAHSFHFSLSIPMRAALFLTAWLIYLADRLADTRTLRGGEPVSLRQEFCRRHQTVWFASIACLAGIDLWIIARMLNRETNQIGIILGLISLAYLSINYWLGKIWRFIPVKEICIGSLFAIGTAAALIPQTHGSTEIIESFVLFAALCSLNCIALAMWERDLDRVQGKNSVATRWHGIRAWFRFAVVGLAGAGIVAGSMTKIAPQLYLCLAASAFLLGLLDWSGEAISRDERAALADLVLLTPLFVLVFHA